MINKVSVHNTVNKMVQCSDTVVLGTDSGELVVINCLSLEIVGTWKALNFSVSSLTCISNYIWCGFDDGSVSVWELKVTPSLFLLFFTLSLPFPLPPFLLLLLLVLSPPLPMLLSPRIFIPLPPSPFLPLSLIKNHGSPPLLYSHSLSLSS